MRIDALKTTPDRAGRYWATFSAGSKMGLYRQSVEDFGLYPGRELSDEEMAALRESAGQVSAKMRAVRIVSASSVSRQDLEQRLVHKGEDPEQARQAVEWMEELNLIDDAALAQQVVRRCIDRGYGLQRAKQALYEKRVPKAYWDAALEDYPDQTEKIVAFLRARLSGGGDDRQVKRAVDALLRRGHSYSAIRQGLKIIEADEDECSEE